MFEKSCDFVETFIREASGGFIKKQTLRRNHSERKILNSISANERRDLEGKAGIVWEFFFERIFLKVDGKYFFNNIRKTSKKQGRDNIFLDNWIAINKCENQVKLIWSRKIRQSTQSDLSKVAPKKIFCSLLEKKVVPGKTYEGF